MIIRITAATTLTQVGIHFMEFQGLTGKILVECDETSSIIENGVLKCKMKGVYFNDHYANGRCSDIDHARLIRVCLSTTDAYDSLDFSNPNIFQNIYVQVEDGNQFTEWHVENEPKIIWEEE